jgi:hypothetical protein
MRPGFSIFDFCRGALTGQQPSASTTRPKIKAGLHCTSVAATTASVDPRPLPSAWSFINTIVFRFNLGKPTSRQFGGMEPYSTP